ncbi:MAG: DUF3883 domain-containing protein [Bacteroidota bacterium]|nr:DUF3883 domain-containing protein [Bacteroidota bacterium]
MTDDYIPKSSDEWKSWLAEQEKINIEVYLKQPQRIIQDYNTEKETTRDYIGREIFELLQNANDAAAEVDQRGKVLIELTNDLLIVANSGEPFSIGGVNSLLFSHISPKKKRKNLIGQKGLGFRSVLNWCQQPTIFSGHLNLAYQESKRKILFDKLISKKEEIATLIKREREYPDEVIIPTLPFPCFIDASSVISDQLFNKLFKIRNQNYDTVIGIPFDKPEYYTEAKKQLVSLDSAIMLFAGSLDEILIRIDDEIYSHWMVEERDKQKQTATIKWHDSQKIHWQIYEHSGVINNTQSSIKSDLGNEYTMIIAIPKNQKVDSSTPLFSFFPLELKFPFPVFCHVTLELEGNRKHPRPSASNIAILKELTKFFAEKASQQDISDDPWSRIRLLARSSELDKFLADIDFDKILIEEARRLNIVPTLGGMHLTASKTKQINAKKVHWLPQEQFSNIALSPSSTEITNFYNALGIEFISNGDLTEKLNMVEFPDIAARATLIANLIKHNLIPENPVPHLLIEQSGSRITENSRTFLQSREQKVFERPEWLNIQFLHDELRIKLMEQLELTEVRELRQKLSPFGVNEYSLSSIASALIAEANKRITSEPTKKKETYDDLFITLFYLYSQRGEASFPEDIAVPLRTKAGSYESAKTLYFSESYSVNGDWLSELYKLTPDKLLANLSDLGVDGNDLNYISFLKWIGVADFPREIILDSVENSYKNYVLDSLPYEPDGIILGEYKYKRREDFNEPEIRSIKSFDGIENFPKADPAAIIVWLALDSRCNQLRSNHPSFALLTDRPSGVRRWNRKTYTGPIPHYAKWGLESSSWLIITDGSKRKPSECMIGEKSLEKIFPSPARFKHPLFDKYLHDPIMFRRAWENAGVIPDVNYLSRNQIKDILIALPEKNPSGESTGTFYRNILDEIRTGNLEWDGPDYDFISNGKMWGKGPEGFKYYQVNELHHTDSQQFPEILTSKLKMVDLPKRYRNTEIKHAFGIEPLDSTKLKFTDIQFEKRPESDSLQSQFNQIKHLLLALRPPKSRKSSEVSNFRAIELVTCAKIEVGIAYELISIKTEFIEAFKWIIKDGKAFILVPDTQNASFRSAVCSRSVGQIVASVFNLENPTEFASIIQADEADRHELLKQMLGEEVLPDLDKLKQELKTDEAPLPPIIIPPLENGNHTSTPSGGAKPPIGFPPTTVTPATPEPPVPISTDTVKISPEEHEPSPPKKPKEVVRKKESVPTFGGGETKRVTNWKRCEELAVVFEESEIRFPIKVSDIVGYKGPKCDVLSFSSAEQRIIFQQLSSDEKNINDVERFIEVKGSVNEKGAIDLKGNELTAAKIYSNKYFLYRMYEKTQNEYYVLIVVNPLNQKEALEEIWEIIPDRAKDATRFHIEIGIQEMKNP